MKTILTEYTQYCAVCGSPATEIHHLVFGRGLREKSDKDGLVIPLCRLCHEELHQKSTVATMFSRIIGQLAYEKHIIATEGVSEYAAREKFRQRYHESFL